MQVKSLPHDVHFLLARLRDVDAFVHDVVLGEDPPREQELQVLDISLEVVDVVLELLLLAGYFFLGLLHLHVLHLVHAEHVGFPHVVE